MYLQQIKKSFEQLKYFFPVKPKLIYVFIVLPSPSSVILSFQNEW